jgi:hypothetical protein
LENRCLMSALAAAASGTGNNVTRTGQALVIDAADNVFASLQTGKSTLLLTKRDAAGDLVWSNELRIGLKFKGQVPLAATGDGGVVVAGQFLGTVDFDPSPGTTELTAATRATFLARYDADGALVWVRQIQGKGFYLPAAVEVAAGQVVLAGSFRGTVDFDPSGGAANLTSVGGFDMAIARYDTDGLYLASQQIGGKGQDFAYDLDIDSTGRTYLVGEFTSEIDADPGVGTTLLESAGNTDGLVARFSAAGVLEFAGQIGGRSRDAATRVAVGPSDEVWIGGRFTGRADIDPTGGTVLANNLGKDDLFLAQLNAAGAVTYTGVLASKSNQYLGGITVTAAGDLLVAAPYGQNLDLDPGPGTLDLPDAKTNGFFTLRLNSAGAVLNAQWIGGGEFINVWDVQSDSAGRSWVLGNTLHERTDFDPDPDDVFRIKKTKAFLSVLEVNGDFHDAEKL